MELRAFTLSHSSAIFVMGILEIGFLELFVWAVFKQLSS
jgi:hypothetical protein